MPAPIAFNEVRDLFNHSPDKALARIKQAALTPSDISELLLTAIKYHPSEDLICFLIGQGGTIPDALFFWLIRHHRTRTFQLLVHLGYQPPADCHDDEYGATLTETALFNKNHTLLSLISGRNRLGCFLQTRFGKRSLHSQFWIIRRLQLLDFPQEMKGICYVTAMFGGQALLIGQAETFQRRTILIQQTPASKLPKKIAKAYQRRKTKQPLTQTHQDYLDFVDFGHAVALMQGHHYPEWDKALQSNNDMPRYFLNSLQSIELEKMGGIQWIGSECEVMVDLDNPGQLTNYFFALQRILDRSHKTLAQKQAVFVYISAANHGVSLGYDIKTQEWYFTDANHPRVMFKVDSTDKLANCLSLAFRSFGTTLPFGFSLLTTGENEIRAKAMVEPYWHSLHHHYFKAVKKAKPQPMPWAVLPVSCTIIGAGLCFIVIAYPNTVLSLFSFLSASSSLTVLGLSMALPLVPALLFTAMTFLVIFLVRKGLDRVRGMESSTRELSEPAPPRLATRHTFFQPEVCLKADAFPQDAPPCSF